MNFNPKRHRAAYIETEHLVPQRILIVEDNAINMRLLDSLMQTQGFETILSIDGTDTLELAHDHHPDLIILDSALPYLSGVEIVQMLKRDSTLAHIPVIAMTAYAKLADEGKFRGKGFDGYLAKPVSALDILNTVAGLIGSPAPSHTAEVIPLNAGGQSASA